MRKAFFIITAFILLLGVSGCGSDPAVKEKPSLIDSANACNIAHEINAIHTFRVKCLSRVPPLPDGAALEDAKGYASYRHWPEGLSDEEERAAWKLIVIKGGGAYLIPEAQEALQGLAQGCL